MKDLFMMKYTEFVKQFSAKNSGLKGPELMKAAAAEWKKHKAASTKKKSPKKSPKKSKSKGSKSK